MVVRRIAFGLAVVLAAAAAAVALFLRSSLPVTGGTLILKGLDAPVEVTRDAHGIPTIRASDEHDADFALGFVHAQDRLFQMDMMRRYGAGTLSAVFGARTLQIDRTMRTLGLYRTAEAQLGELSPPVRAALQAYAAGVNAFIAARRGALPPEYYLLGIGFEPWQPADSLVWGKIMDLQLTGNYRGELLRARLLRHLSPAALAVLYPPYPKTAPVALGTLRALYERLPLGRLYALLPPGVGPQQASNNWVVDGAYSQSGKPILANDPHLDFAAPGVWYLARIETPDHVIAGATAPGVPFVIIGHNRHIAWGFTDTGSDVEDLFVERADPTDPTRYMAPGGPLPFAVRQERIAVRGGRAVAITVRSTRHGPVISDLAGDGAPQGEMLALEATWLQPDDTTPQAFYEIDHARDWTAFHAALADLVAPQQNIVYADTAGHIAFAAPARIPIRASGDGWIPEPGWDGKHDWTGYVPFTALPLELDPPDGHFVSANNKIVPDNYPYFLTRNWQPPYRAERIAALLEQIPKQSVATSAAIQGDDLSLAAQALLPLMLRVRPQNAAAEAAVARLRGWNGRMNRNRPEPLIFVAWLRDFSRRVLASKLGPYLDDYWGLRPNVMVGILTAHKNWCEAAPTAEPQCAAALSQSLDNALAGLARRYGKDMAQWRWGEAHEATFRSALWRNVPLVSRWVALAIPADGAEDTVDAGLMDVRYAADPFRDLHGPTLRMIVDLAHPGDARFMIVPGQSGNPLSPHWGDLLRPWRNLAYIQFGNDTSGGTLTLRPR